MIRQKMIRYILLIAVFQLTLAESESYDLMVRGKSNPYCKISPDHTMCKYEAEQQQVQEDQQGWSEDCC